MFNSVRTYVDTYNSQFMNKFILNDMFVLVVSKCWQHYAHDNDKTPESVVGYFAGE